jgi:transcriptional regulator with XRE-family HTH domain
MISTNTDEPRVIAANLRRLMARHDLTQGDLVQAAGLDERTIRGVLRGRVRCHARTINKLAGAMGVEVGQLLRDPDAAARQFDRDTNAVLRVYVAEHPELFRNWSEAELDDLASRFGCGGQLTEEGIVAAVKMIERRREVLARVAVLMECRADETETIVGALYAGAVVRA